MIEILLNDVMLDGMRRVRVVSDAPVDTAALCPYKPVGACVREWRDEALGLHYVEATWACREAVSIRVSGWKCARKMVLWKLQAGERVSEALKDALAVYGERFKSFPAYAFLRRLPRGIEFGFEVEDVMLMDAEWVPAGCIAVWTPTLPSPKWVHLGEGKGG